MAAATYFAFPAPSGSAVPQLRQGQSAERDIVAPINFAVLKSGDQIAGELAAAASRVPPVFGYRPDAIDSALSSIERWSEAATGEAGGVAAAEAVLSLTPTELEWLAAGDHRELVAAAARKVLSRTLARGMADPGAMELAAAGRVIVIRNGAESVVSVDSLATLADLFAAAEEEAARLPPPAGPIFRKLLITHYRPSLVPDADATSARIREARLAVDSAKRVVPQGTLILAAGEPAGDRAVEDLASLSRTLQSQPPEEAVARAVVAPLLVNMMVLGVLWLLIQYYRPEVYRRLRHMGLIASLLVMVVLSSAALLQLAPGRPELFPIPLAAILVSILLGGRLAIVVVAMMALLLGSQAELRDSYFLLLALVTGVAGALAVDDIRRHNQMITVAGIVWGAGILAIATIALMEGWTAPDFTASVLLTGLGVLGSAAMALILLPVAEWLTRITSNLSLVGLADPTRPLLRRLATEAPGTWAHSLTIASLAESACNAIGANGLLARVGCYYHDVGKLVEPGFFVENQLSEGNPHDQLSPVRSAEAIRRHVPEGLRLAREARLPPEVSAFISEHHGTGRIQYFFDRARAQQPDSQIEESPYRYPGPRPRSAETAIAMLADSVEAGIRVLGNPSPGQIREAVDHIVKRRLDEGQLADAPITLAQLQVAKQEFARALGGVMHSRVEYSAPTAGSRPVQKA